MNILNDLPDLENRKIFPGKCSDSWHQVMVTVIDVDVTLPWMNAIKEI
jgi:hypothetical protein